MEEKNQTPEVLFKDSVFIQNVRDKFSELVKKRSARQDAPTGYRYKRDWYDRMKTACQLNSDFILANVLQVHQKTSSLSSEVRDIITYLTIEAAKATSECYKAQAELAKKFDNPEDQKEWEKICNDIKIPS